MNINICSIAVIKDRISTAEKHSPIHVFKIHKDGLVNLYCAFDTISARKRIDSMDTNYIGTYTKHSKDFQVDEELRKAGY